MRSEDLENLRKEVSVLKAKVNVLESEKGKLESTKNAAVEKAIDDAKNALKGEYEKQIVKLNDLLKNAEKEKEKEKSKIIKEKIENATKGKKESIYYLKRNIKTIIREKNLSPLVNTGIFFTIISPKTIGERIKGIIVAAILLGGIPSVLAFLVFPNSSIWTKLMMYICNVFVWGLLYLGISQLTKADDATIQEIRELRKDIKTDENEVKKITKEIQNEKIEGENEYTKLDRKIDSIKLDLKDIAEKEKQALDIFESSTVNEIKNKIEKEAEKEFKQNEKETKKARLEYEKKNEEYEKAKLEPLEVEKPAEIEQNQLENEENGQ